KSESSRRRVASVVFLLFRKSCVVWVRDCGVEKLDVSVHDKHYVSLAKGGGLNKFERDSLRPIDVIENRWRIGRGEPKTGAARDEIRTAAKVHAERVFFIVCCRKLSPTS